jgi:uncharacterized membrane protein
MASAAKNLPTKQSDNFGTVLKNTFKLIGASWEGFKLNLRTFILIFLPLVVFVSLLVAIPMAVLGINEGDTSINTSTVNATAAAASAVAMLGLLVSVVLLSIAVTIATLSSARGKKVSAKDILNQSFPLFWPAVALGLLTILAVFLGLIALIVPAILAVFFFTFAIYVLVDKRVSPVDALKESYRLTKRNWKLVLSYYIVTAVIQIPSSIPGIGGIITFGLSMAYLVLPAILYVRMQKQNPVKAIVKK